MKLLAAILTVYILGLIAFPCHDLSRDKTVHRVELSSNESSQGHDLECDLCSPFCTCNCCASLIALQDTFIQFKCFSFVQKQFPLFSNLFVFSTFASIWQPPKLA